MSREITCYVHDGEDYLNRYAIEYTVTLRPKAGYTPPTTRDMDELEASLTGKLHKSEAALKRIANGSAFDLRVEIDGGRSVRRSEMPMDLQEQADQYDADSVRHLR